MSSHVVDAIADYLEGRLSPGERHHLEEHLAACEECSAQMSFANEFRENAVRQGLKHPASRRLVSLADGAPPTAAEREHLASCSECQRDMEWLHDLPEDGSEAEEADEPPGASATATVPFSVPGWLWGGLTAVAASLLVLFMVTRPGPDIAGLAHIEALRVEIDRGPVPPGSFEAARLRGLESYAAGDYQGAREQLRRALDEQAGDETAGLYLASADLLLGDTEKAAAAFAELADQARSSRVVDEALWQLAQAQMTLEDGDGAGRSLRRLVQRDGRHRRQAQDLLRELERDTP